MYAAPNTTIITDNYGLKYLEDKGTESALVERWICEMGGFNYSIEYRKGKMNIADYLSRLHDVIAITTTRSAGKDTRTDFLALSKGQRRTKKVEEQAKKMVDEDEPEPEDRRAEEKEMEPIQAKQMIREQDRDPYIERLWKIAQGKEVGEVSPSELKDAQGLKRINGMVVKEEISDTGEKEYKVVVPACLQYQVVKEAHEASHAGINGTIALVRHYHWFRGVKTLVRIVVDSCWKCLARKGRPTRKEVLAPDARPKVLGERWHLDGLSRRKGSM